MDFLIHSIGKGTHLGRYLYYAGSVVLLAWQANFCTHKKLFGPAVKNLLSSRSSEALTKKDSPASLSKSPASVHRFSILVRKLTRHTPTKMPTDDRTVAIFAVLASVALLSGSLVVTYRCNTSLFKRQHRAKTGQLQTTKVETEGINPEKLTRFLSHSSLRSYPSTNTRELSSKNSKASTLTYCE